jgi:hypothetical protein
MRAIHALGRIPMTSWTRERKIYLAVGVLASLAGVLLIAFSL